MRELMQFLVALSAADIVSQDKGSDATVADSIIYPVVD